MTLFGFRSNVPLELGQKESDLTHARSHGANELSFAVKELSFAVEELTFAVKKLSFAVGRN